MTPETVLRRGWFLFFRGCPSPWRGRVVYRKGWARSFSPPSHSSLVTAGNLCPAESEDEIYFTDRIYDSCNMQIADAHVTLLAVTRYVRSSKRKLRRECLCWLAGRRLSRGTHEKQRGKTTRREKEKGGERERERAVRYTVRFVNLL